MLIKNPFGWKISKFIIERDDKVMKYIESLGYFRAKISDIDLNVTNKRDSKILETIGNFMI